MRNRFINMKIYLAIALMLGLTACSDSAQKESSINRDNGSAAYSEKSKLVTNSESNYSNGFSSHQALNSQPVTVDVNTNNKNLYTVNKHDTLMKIAFKIYGDYEKWRMLKKLNADKVGPNNLIIDGANLVYPAPDTQFIQNTNGNPYFIKHGDTLMSISRTAYGTEIYWKAIWKNNIPLIKNPHNIFSGFVIYTPFIDDLDNFK